MAHITTAMTIDRRREPIPFRGRTISPRHTVLVVRDDSTNNEFLEAVCEFLDIGVEHASGGGDLGPLLNGLRPMAVIADLDGETQDGFHVLKVVADYSKRLPVMLLTANEPGIDGAVDAVKEVWGLQRVATASGMESVGEVVDFLCHAAREAGHFRLMRI